MEPASAFRLVNACPIQFGAYRVKICGITRPEDAALAAELGADAIGLNFVGGPRKLGQAQSHKIYWALYDDNAHSCRASELVALINIDAESPGEPWRGHRRDFEYDPAVWQIYSASGEHLAQSHWYLNAEQWWLTFSIQRRESIADLNVYMGLHNLAPKAVLLDTSVHGLLGGTGQSFNWHWIAEARAAGELNGLPPIILAGGLTPENVAEAIRMTHAPTPSGRLFRRRSPRQTRHQGPDQGRVTSSRPPNPAFGAIQNL